MAITIKEFFCSSRIEQQLVICGKDGGESAPRSNAKIKITTTSVDEILRRHRGEGTTATSDWYDEQFDLVLLEWALDNRRKSECLAILAEVYRLLRSGGTVIVTTTNPLAMRTFPMNVGRFVRRSCSPRQGLNILRKLGFKSVSAHVAIPDAVNPTRLIDARSIKPRRYFRSQYTQRTGVKSHLRHAAWLVLCAIYRNQPWEPHIILAGVR